MSNLQSSAPVKRKAKQTVLPQNDSLEKSTLEPADIPERIPN